MLDFDSILRKLGSHFWPWHLPTKSTLFYHAIAALKSTAQKFSFYLFLYAIVVVLFAVAFTIMPGQFYHSTTLFEPETKEFKNKVQEELVRDIKRNISPQSPNAATIGTWSIPT